MNRRLQAFLHSFIYIYVMQESNSKIPFSTKLGFVTGPLFIILGLYLKFKENESIGIIFALIGIFRLGLTSWLFFKHPGRKS